VPSRLTFDPGFDVSPVWSPEGTRIVFGGERSGKLSLRQQPINRRAADEVLLEGDFLPSSWSADGRFIAYTDSSPARAPDVWVLPLVGDRKPFPVLQTRFGETSAVFSPNGQWIAYSSNAGGQGDVYVESFPPAGGKYQVSRDGGGRPLWRADGKELFYVRTDGAMMAVPIDTTGQFDAGEPQTLFFFTAGQPINSRPYAVTKDGQRFLAPDSPQQSGVMPLTVVLDWTAAIHK
jgi:Tol biopolymer transport system component